MPPIRYDTKNIIGMDIGDISS